MAHRTVRRLAAASCVILCAAALASSCGGDGTRPCSDCPDVAGTWALSFEAGGTPPAACDQAGLSLPTDPLTLRQVGSALSASVSGAELRGTLYDSYDFNLNGRAEGDGGVSTTVSLNGQYVGPRPAIDAGEQLVGTYVGTRADCILTRKYSAFRQ